MEIRPIADMPVPAYGLLLLVRITLVPQTYSGILLGICCECMPHGPSELGRNCFIAMSLVARTVRDGKR